MFDRRLHVTAREHSSLPVALRLVAMRFGNLTRCERSGTGFTATVQLAAPSLLECRKRKRRHCVVVIQRWAKEILVTTNT